MPVSVEVIAYTPTEFYHCTHCEVTWHELGVGGRVHREQAESAIPAELREEYLRLCDWLAGLLQRYGERVRVNVVDAVSIEGFLKSLRYRARDYPVIVIDGRETVARGDYRRAEALLASRLGAAAEISARGGGV